MTKQIIGERNPKSKWFEVVVDEKGSIFQIQLWAVIDGQYRHIVHTKLNSGSPEYYVDGVLESDN